MWHDDKNFGFPSRPNVKHYPYTPAVVELSNTKKTKTWNEWCSLVVFSHWRNGKDYISWIRSGGQNRYNSRKSHTKSSMHELAKHIFGTPGYDQLDTQSQVSNYVLPLGQGYTRYIGVYWSVDDTRSPLYGLRNSSANTCNEGQQLTSLHKFLHAFGRSCSGPKIDHVIFCESIK